MVLGKTFSRALWLSSSISTTEKNGRIYDFKAQLEMLANLDLSFPNCLMKRAKFF